MPAIAIAEDLLLPKVRIGEKVSLNEGWQAAIQPVAILRHQRNREEGVRDSRLGDQDAWKTDLEGLGSEVAGAILFNCCPDLSIEPRSVSLGTDALADCLLRCGLTVDWKGTPCRHGHLLATPWKHGSKGCRPDLFGLIIGEFPHYEFRGFMEADDLLREHMRKNLRRLPVGRDRWPFASMQDQLVELPAVRPGRGLCSLDGDDDKTDGVDAMPDVLVFEKTVIVDCNEQLPWPFRGLRPEFGETPEDGCPACGFQHDPDEHHPYVFNGYRADARQKNLPLVINTRVGNLLWGDYSLEGYERAVAVERKGFTDLFGTFGGRREQFEAEIKALHEDYEAAAVVIEAPWSRILGSPPKQTKLNPLTIWRTVMAWSQRYHRVSWWACEDRNFAERTCFRFLERFLRDKVDPPEARKARKKKAPPP